MSETYDDIPEETLNDVMCQIAEERERRDWIDAGELRRRIEVRLRHIVFPPDDAAAMGELRVYEDVLGWIDEMQGR